MDKSYKYKPQRHQDWNFGGPRFRLSRSKIDLFVECPRCFYIDNKIGTARPRGYPFNLNSAVDELLKKEFDQYRLQQKPHPNFAKWGIEEVIPFAHRQLDVWRENFSGIETYHKETGLTVSGAVDDIWVNSDGEVSVVDYKATSKEGEVGIDAPWQGGYKRQLEVYQWLLRRNGLKVSDTAYILYANARRDLPEFNQTLTFDLSLHPYRGNDSWVDKALEQIHKVLNQDKIPAPNSDCEYCAYTRAYYQAFQGQVPEKESPNNLQAKKSSNFPKTLFD